MVTNSQQIQKSENIKKSFFSPKNTKNLKTFCQLRRLVFDQSSPVHPLSDFRGGGLSLTNGGQRTEILVSNIGFTLENN